MAGEALEVYEVSKILGKRLNAKKQVEYLVKWIDQADCTWEPFENLATCAKLVEEFNLQENDTVKALPKPQNHEISQFQRKRDKKTAFKEEKELLQNKGSLQKGHKIYRVIGLSKSRKTGQLYAKVEWEPEENEKSLLEDSFVPVDLLKQSYPQILLAYYEFESCILGNKNAERYELYTDYFVNTKRQKQKN
eukprot:403354248